MPFQEVELTDVQGGINTAADPRDIADNQFQELDNIEYTKQNRLASRRGVDLINTTNPSIDIQASIVNADFDNPRWFLFDAARELLFVANDGSDNVIILDVATPGNGFPIATLSDGGTNINSPAGMALADDGTTLYIANRATSVVTVVDTTDPRNPTIGTSVAASGNPVSCAYKGNWLYVTSFNGDAVHVFDVSTRSTPTLDNTLTDATNLNGAHDIDINSAGTYLFVSALTGDRVTVVDVSTPTAPSVTGSVTDTLINGAQKLTYVESQDYVYVCAFGGSGFGTNLVSIDVSTKATPAVDDNLDLGDGINASALTNPISSVRPGPTGFLLFSSGTTDTVSVVSISDPSAMIEVNSIQSSNINEPRAVIYDSVDSVVFVGNNDTTDTVHALSVGFGGVISELANYQETAATGDTNWAVRIGSSIYACDSANHTLNVWSVTNRNSLSAPTATTSASDLNSPSDMDAWTSGGIDYGVFFDTTTPQFYIWQISGTPAVQYNSPGLGTGASTGRAVAYANGYVYMTFDTSGVSDTTVMRIYDVTTPSAPSLVGTLFDDGSGDFTNPGRPVPFPNNSNYVFLVGNSGGSSKGIVVDVTTPSAPTVAQKFDLVNVSSGASVLPGFHPSEDLLYVPQNSGSLYVYDTSTPTAVSLIGNSPSGYANLDAIVVDQAASPKYIIGGTLGSNTIVVFSIADPENPVVSYEFSNANTTSVKVFPNFYDSDYEETIYAFSETGSDRLLTLDTQTLSSVEVLKIIEDVNLNGARDILVNQTAGRAYVAAYDSDSLTILDISTFDEPEELSDLVDATNLVDIHSIAMSIDGNYVYATSETGDRFSIVDITDELNPSIAGTVTHATNLNGARGIAVDPAGTYAYVAARNNNGIAVIDVSDPTSPSIVGTLTDATNLSGVSDLGADPNGSYVYALDYNNGRFVVIDVTVPASPAIDNQLDDANYVGADRIEVGATHAYFTAQSTDYFVIIDISTPTAVTEAGKLTSGTDLNQPVGLYIDEDNNRAYVASTGTDKIAVLLISDKTAPSVELTLVPDISDPTGIWGDGNSVAVAFNAGDAVGTYVLSGVNLTNRVTSIHQHEDPDDLSKTIIVTSGTEIYTLDSNNELQTITGVLDLPFNTLWQWKGLDGLAIGVNGGGTGVTSLVKWDGTGQASALTSDLPADNTAKYIEVWNFRLFVAIDSVLYFSKLGDPSNFTDSTSGFIEVDPDRGGPITGLYEHKGFLWIFKRDLIYRIQPGVPNTSASLWSVELAINNLGCVSGYSIQSVLDDVFFLTQAGVASLAAADVVGDFEAAILSTNIRELRGVSGQRDDYPAIVDEVTSHYIISLDSTQAGVTQNDISYVLDFKRMSEGVLRWTTWSGTAVGASYAQVIDSNGDKQLYIGGYNNIYVKNREGDANEFDDNTAAISWTITTKEFDFQASLLRKGFERFLLDVFKLASALELTVQLLLDEETSAPSNRTFTLDFDSSSNPLRVHRKIPGERSGNSGALKITGSEAGAGFELRRVYLQISPKTARHSSVI